MLAISSDTVLSSLEQDGIAVLPDFVTGEELRSMQLAFESRLKHLHCNDVDGYEKERFRHNVPDVLTLDQGFVDAPLNPLVSNALREYLGAGYQLVEAKGWKSLPTTRDFHGWHGDAWYDQSKTSHIAREVKLALYLTDVKTGFFEYVKGSHQKQAPRRIKNHEVQNVAEEQIVRVKGSAGTAFLFDTSGIHRQGVPILEPRCAVFYNYHDPAVPLQKEDVDYYRYHPLILNAAFLGKLTADDRNVLGFGDKRNYVHAFTRKPRYPGMHNVFEKMLDLRFRWASLQERISGRAERLLGKRS